VKYKKYAIGVSISVVVFLVIMTMYVNSLRYPIFSTWTYTNINGDINGTRKIALPFGAESNGTYGIFESDFIVTKKPIQKLMFKADDCLDEIYINGKLIFNESSCGRCEHCFGKEIDINDFIEPGYNEVKVIVNDWGGHIVGFDITYPKNRFQQALFILVGLAVFVLFVLFIFHIMPAKIKHTYTAATFLEFWNKIPGIFKWIGFLFLGTRLGLLITGSLARPLLNPFSGYQWQRHGFLLLDIWSQWDSDWYLRIASNWYPQLAPSVIQPNYNEWAFFPLYPVLMKGFGFIFGNYIAGLIISNTFLIVAAIFLYKLIKLDEGEAFAKKTVKYMFLFPTAFILSGIFTESLMLALILICFYYARKEKWYVVGIAGFFLSLVKATGVLIFLPMVYEYAKSKSFNLKKITKESIFLFFIPAGAFLWTSYNIIFTSSIAFFGAQKAWGRLFTSPLAVLADLVNPGVPLNMRFSLIFIFVCLFVVLISIKKIRFSYLLLILYTIFVPMFLEGYAYTSRLSLPRYILVAFPIYIAIAYLAKNRTRDNFLTVFLLFMQGAFMVIWSNGFEFII
jgi:hypothetical protein